MAKFMPSSRTLMLSATAEFSSLRAFATYILRPIVLCLKQAKGYIWMSYQIGSLFGFFVDYKRLQTNPANDTLCYRSQSLRKRYTADV